MGCCKGSGIGSSFGRGWNQCSIAESVFSVESQNLVACSAMFCRATSRAAYGLVKEKAEPPYVSSPLSVVENSTG